MEQRSDGRATHGAADGKAGVRRAPRGIVLCGKYSSALRKVQFRHAAGHAAAGALVSIAGRIGGAAVPPSVAKMEPAPTFSGPPGREVAIFI